MSIFLKVRLDIDAKFLPSCARVCVRLSLLDSLFSNLLGLAEDGKFEIPGFALQLQLQIPGFELPPVDDRLKVGRSVGR